MSSGAGEGEPDSAAVEATATGEVLGVPAPASLAEELARGAGAGHIDVAEVLAAALGVPPGALAAMTREEATVALRRVEALARRVQRLEAAVSTDDLTGALRRRAGMVVLRREVQRARRGGQPLSVAFVDVDGLKRVNDSEGHAAGDRLLRDVAAALRTRLRAYDAIIRMGGDEFVAILPGADLPQAEAVLRDVRANLEALSRPVRISVGLARLEIDDTAETLVERADVALYAARRAREVESAGG
jgi:diguanylate cyclase (GGDEF)-like protein